MDRYQKQGIGILFAVYLLLIPGAIFAQQTGFNDLSMEAPPIAEVGQASFQGLSPAQQNAAIQEMGKTGGKLTPGAIDALKGRPEFQNLSPAEVARGRELLQKQEAAKKEVVKPAGLEKKKEPTGKDTEAGKKGSEEIRQVIGEVPKSETLFERAQATGKYQDISLDLRPFGYDFFRDASVKVVTDSRNIPIPIKYVVGPGDEVRVALWGRVNASYSLTVDRDGKIAIPTIGPLAVAGMTFEQMSTYLIKQAEQITGTNVDISMGALRTIPVFILGDVRKPGAYTIGSFATITDALLLAGGPTEIGSMRNIQLRRKDKIIQTFDLYDLLLKGDKSRDVILSAGDIVFVPVIGPYVGVAGNVRRPALYELRDNFSLESLFDLAGGIIPMAYTQQIQVERTVRNEKKIVIDIDDKKLVRTKTFILQDADIIKVFSIVDKDVNVVHLSGNVKKGGKYALTAGMQIRDVLRSEKDLLPETYFDYALIKRFQPPTMEALLIPFNLGDLLLRNDSASNLALQPQDNIYVFNRSFFRDKPTFTVKGEVRKGGQFDLTDQFMVKDAILTAGDLTKDAYLKKGEIIRLNKNKEYFTLYFDVGRALAGDPAENFLIQDEDQIIIHSVWEEVYKKSVTIEGEVTNPGVYQLTEKMTLKDLVFKAGNILESAYPYDAEIASLTTGSGREALLVWKNIDLQKALAGDPGHNALLMPYDHLFIKRIPDWRPDKFVGVEGEVKFPGRYLIKKGEKLSSLIERAGGYKENAYLRGAFFTRDRVRDLQQKGLLEMADRLERELMSSAGTLSTATSAEEIAGKKSEMEQRQKFVESLRKIKATGRMTIYLAHLRLLKGSEYDIDLEEGDKLLIPEKNSVVNVVGAVMTQGTHIYSERMGYQDYVGESGGYSRYADTDNIFVLKVDGSARKLARGFLDWSAPRNRWELAGYGSEVRQIEPGDTIVVPEKVDRIAWLREVKDFTQILMNTAVVAGVFKALY